MEPRLWLVVAEDTGGAIKGNKIDLFLILPVKSEDLVEESKFVF